MRDSSFFTKVVHHKADQTAAVHSKATPIYQTSAFTFKDLDDLEKYYEGETSYLYSRERNPNPEELAEGVAALEEGSAGVAAASGMAAIFAGILSVVKPGDHILAAEDVYGGTHNLLSHELPSLGIEVTLTSFRDQESIKGEIRPNTKLLYSESVTNPFLRVEDMTVLQEIAGKNDLKIMIDNTFATPYLLRPLKQGADLVVHSATKYLGGHSDATAGVLTGERELVEKARQKIVSLGSNLSPFEAWLTYRGTKTLGIRMEKQSRNAQALADAMQRNADVEKVYYPENVSAEGNGAIVTIALNKSIEMNTFYRTLGWIKIVPSLAGVETTVSVPSRTSHRALSAKDKERFGIDDHVVRVSVGIESSDDISAQLEQAIEASK
ncbi:cystathionine gamma-synthase [Salimicrobium jeotgali]|uniref:homocysteine desulfhydrase n=1 Tax=Salimicrobium jeotgali TaxID=1230341 RepID=K2GL72_9BACI|nr:aminotransferase class I/II-fold pyridoxal phosphate-dependent enzyme [Salimicrobium jeotgali]AKG05420.1 cystathionine gamma-synthase [Salimicrobium jeotgali]EKE31114.1 cystathionine gamma-synthase [Salimicrobium jeotgali]MBM7697275.1 cystathionine beta-lyase/cystathionine gamma-synthase [Salimicrobium jeotgali]